MKQHNIDLLPESIRARSQARLRMGRYVACGLVAVVLIIVSATHTRLGLERARAELVSANDQANLVLDVEAKADELSLMIADVQAHIDRYDRIALPINASEVVATLINRLPQGATLDRIDLDAGVRRMVRTPRSKNETARDHVSPRVLIAEISGFAPNDKRIAEFVTNLEQASPFRDVSLDFSRTRAVRGFSAREFRLSFRIDLEATYVRAAGSPEQTEDEGNEEADHG